MEGSEDIGKQEVWSKYRYSGIGSLTVCRVYTNDYHTGYILIAGNICMVRYVAPTMKYYQEIVKPIGRRDMEVTSKWEML